MQICGVLAEMLYDQFTTESNLAHVFLLSKGQGTFIFQFPGPVNLFLLGIQKCFGSEV